MYNKDPYVQFNPDNRVFWACRTGLSELDDKELEATYQRAHNFFTECIKALIKDHKWRELDLGTRQIFLSLSSDGYIHRFTLPKTFSSLSDLNRFADWKMQFETGVFEAKRPSLTNNDFYISGPTVLSDMFYLFQSIAPGMLVIAGRIGQLEDMGDMEYLRALPRESWIIDNASTLKHILGTTTSYEALLDASRDQDKAFATSWVSPWDDDSSDCRSTGSGRIDDEWDDTEYDWPPQQAMRTTAWTCSSKCDGCSQCDI